MDPTIIAALIAAASVIIAALIARSERRKDVLIKNVISPLSEEYERTDEEEKIKREAIKELERKQPNELDVVFEYDSQYIDIDKEGNCSVVRRSKIVPSLMMFIRDKKFFLTGDESIVSYLSKKGQEVFKLNPDREFGITAFDTVSKVRLPCATYIKEPYTLVTNLVFYNDVTHNNPIEIEISYFNLDVNFFWTKLWKEHKGEWVINMSNHVKEIEAEILFPETLPPWFRKTEIGKVLSPPNWAEVTEDTKNNRRRLFLKAVNLAPNRPYKLIIDIG